MFSSLEATTATDFLLSGLVEHRSDSVASSTLDVSSCRADGIAASHQDTCDGDWLARTPVSGSIRSLVATGIVSAQLCSFVQSLVAGRSGRAISDLVTDRVS